MAIDTGDRTPHGEALMLDDRDFVSGYLSELAGHQLAAGPYLPTLQDIQVLSAAAKLLAVSETRTPITDNDKRWRILEHGCQWVSFTPIGGETHSFDPRDVRYLKAMRAFADEISAKQIAILREGIEQFRKERK
jgi:hypothetical protein